MRGDLRSASAPATLAPVDNKGIFLVRGGALGVGELSLESVLLHLQTGCEVVATVALEHPTAHLDYA